MRNPARLAAELSGRPLLLHGAALPPLARALMLAESGDDGLRTPFARLMGHARRLVARRDEADEPVAEPSCYQPRWLGEPDDMGFGWTLKDGIGCIEIRGPLMAEGFGWGDTWYHGYDTLLQAYEEMASDPRVLGVFEVLQTPGGVVDPGLPELAAFKRGMRAAAGGKPIWAYVRTAYSAGMWHISSSDRRIGARESGVGSVGAVIGHCDLSGSLENDGIKYRAFKFGARKTDGSPLEPLSETAEATLQAEVDQCGRWFVSDLLAGMPNLTEEAILATEAGCFFGDSDDPALSGLGHGLLDAIMTERGAFEALRAEIGTQTGPAPAPNISPAAPSGAAPAAAKEIDMKRSTVLAALERAGIKGSQLTKVKAELPEDETAEGEDDEEAQGDEPSADDEGAEGEDAGEPEAADGDDDDSEAAAEDDEDEGKVDARTARAIMNLPQARGREKLANRLAFTPGMTVKQAGRLLSDAPRGDRLADRMQGRDPNLTSGGGAPAAGGVNKAGAALVAAAKARAEKQRKRAA